MRLILIKEIITCQAPLLLPTQLRSLLTYQASIRFSMQSHPRLRAHIIISNHWWISNLPSSSQTHLKSTRSVQNPPVQNGPWTPSSNFYCCLNSAFSNLALFLLSLLCLHFLMRLSLHTWEASITTRLVCKAEEVERQPLNTLEHCIWIQQVLTIQGRSREEAEIIQACSINMAIDLVIMRPDTIIFKSEGLRRWKVESSSAYIYL